MVLYPWQNAGDEGILGMTLSTCVSVAAVIILLCAVSVVGGVSNEEAAATVVRDYRTSAERRSLDWFEIMEGIASYEASHPSGELVLRFPDGATGLQESVTLDLDPPITVRGDHLLLAGSSALFYVPFSSVRMVIDEGSSKIIVLR
jgi:hypothetical protein